MDKLTEQQKADCVRVWRKDGFTLRLYYIGTPKLAYQFKDGRKVIFEGADFTPADTHAIDSIESVYDLLGFLCVKPGDTDDEFFKDYTKEQLAWCQSDRGEDLSLLVYDWESKNDTEPS